MVELISPASVVAIFLAAIWVLARVSTEA